MFFHHTFPIYNHYYQYHTIAVLVLSPFPGTYHPPTAVSQLNDLKATKVEVEKWKDEWKKCSQDSMAKSLELMMRKWYEAFGGGKMATLLCFKWYLICVYVYIYICIWYAYYLFLLFFWEGTSVNSFSWSGKIGTTIQELEEMKKELEEAKLISIPEPKDERQTSRFWWEMGSDGFFRTTILTALWWTFLGLRNCVAGLTTEHVIFSSACPWLDISLFFRKAFHSRKTSTIYNEHCFQSPLAFEIVTTTFKTKQVEFWHLDLITRFKPLKYVFKR